MYATINRILPFSCVDGPGNRLTIFLQGCNFKCKNCHNPYTIGHCDNCGDCVTSCPSGALTLNSDGKVQWQQKLCTQCDNCLKICPKSASPMVCTVSVDELLQQVYAYRDFLTGITISGGEATQQYKFIFDFFTAIKTDPNLAHLSCFIDSNGAVNVNVWEKLLPVMDAAMIDLKAWDNLNHKFLTGHGNHQVMNSLNYLSKHGKLYEIRLLVIPGKTDFVEYIDVLSDFLSHLEGQFRLRLNAFQHHGVTHPEAVQWPSATKQEVESLKLLLQQRGFNDIITPSVYL